MALPLQFSRPAEHTASRSLSDKAAFGTLLRDHLVPQAMARNFQTRTLAIWSAGCAEGSELFDIASLLHEHFPALEGWLVTLYGSDAADDAVDVARAARLDGETGGVALRRSCFFEQVDLLDVWPALPVFDIVVCRGTLRDLDLEARENVLTRFQSRLGRDGHVVLGAGESWFGCVSGYRREQYGDIDAFRFSA